MTTSFQMHYSGHHLNNTESKKTSTMTFRIEERILTTLRTESERNNVSLNTLVNQLLKRFVEWDMFEPKVGMIPIAKPILVELFNKMSQEEITKMALGIGKDVIHDIVLFMKNRMDLDSFLSWFEIRMTSSLTETNHSIQDGYHVYILRHELGHNWSLYHKVILELMFNEVFGKAVEVSTTNNLISFKFRV
ncbi:MAG: hypothetical protein M3162_04920 [Thermoproteota archaeon]|nr:hypothetical protein [Thermoproteota archaeon]